MLLCMVNHLPANLTVLLLLSYWEARSVDSATCVSEFFDVIPAKLTINDIIPVKMSC